MDAVNSLRDWEAHTLKDVDPNYKLEDSDEENPERTAAETPFSGGSKGGKESKMK